MKRVLVTGATGFLGRHAARALESAGWRVVRLARRAGADADVTADLSDPFFPGALRGVERCEAIVHLAAVVDWSEAPGPALYRVNVHATSALVTLAQDWRARFVFASTATVCGARTARIDQDTPAAPDTRYAETKWIGEQMIAAARIPAAVLRFGGIFGAGGPAHLGLNRAIDAALQGTAPTVVGSGAARRNYVYVGDAARAIVHALESELTGTHLVAGSEILSVREWLEAVCRSLVPGAAVSTAPGPESADQIVAPSPAFPPTRSLAAALAELREPRS